jgi:hypothetical protein
MIARRLKDQVQNYYGQEEPRNNWSLYKQDTKVS